MYPQEKQFHEPISVGFFYFREDDQQLRDVNTILKTMAFRIAKNDMVYESHAVNMCSSTEDLLTAKGTWKKLFLEFFSSSQNDSAIFLALDGVDEAPREQRQTLLELFLDLQEAPESKIQPRIQIALVGRPEIYSDMQAAY